MQTENQTKTNQKNLVWFGLSANFGSQIVETQLTFLVSLSPQEACHKTMLKMKAKPNQKNKKLNI